MANNELVVENLVVSYGNIEVLHGINLRVSDEPICLMGRNGMGKSTLAQSIMGLLPVSSGTISYGGKVLNNLKPYEIAKSGIAYVPQGRRVFPSLSVHEHLKMLEKRGGTWTTEKVYNFFPRLAERKKNGGAMLSGGEQQMLAIGRALMLNPTLLLMDEPSEGLAPAIVENLAKSLLELVKTGQRILLIEQNLKFATMLSESIVVLSNGEIQAKVSSKDLLSSAELQNKYLGVA